MTIRSRILVDTSVWSLALRLRRKDLSKIERIVVLTLGELIQRAYALIIGPVRLEILSGINDDRFFQSIRDYLREFDDETLSRDDYEEAAVICNLCAASGIASTPNDLLICAVALRLGIPIFTRDMDFRRYARVVPLKLTTADELANEIGQSRRNGR